MPVSRFQMRTVPSPPLLMICWPSGVTATDRTGPGWPQNGPRSCGGTDREAIRPSVLAVTRLSAIGITADEIGAGSPGSDQRVREVAPSAGGRTDA